VKKSLNHSLKQNLLAAIAVSCVAIVSACQQPTATIDTVTTTSAPTTSASPSSKASPTTPSASPSAIPTEAATEKPKSTATIEKIKGEYTIVLDPKVLAEAQEKDGVKSLTGKWTIKDDGTFEANLKAVSVKDEVQEIKTTGKITIENGKVITQVEAVNGEKPPQVPPKQPYNLSEDGKELQAEGQPVKLVKQ
jgi:hypothetical protein